MSQLIHVVTPQYSHTLSSGYTQAPLVDLVENSARILSVRRTSSRTELRYALVCTLNVMLLRIIFWLGSKRRQKISRMQGYLRCVSKNFVVSQPDVANKICLFQKSISLCPLQSKNCQLASRKPSFDCEFDRVFDQFDRWTLAVRPYVSNTSNEQKCATVRAFLFRM